MYGHIVVKPVTQQFMKERHYALMIWLLSSKVTSYCLVQREAMLDDLPERHDY